MTHHSNKNLEDDEERVIKTYPSNPKLRKILIELDKEGIEYYSAENSGCYETSNSTIYPDGTVVKDI